MIELIRVIELRWETFIKTKIDMKWQSIKNILLIIAGSLSLALGMIGLILPVLPTTPFLLLTAYCYLRSSKQMHNWLINHKVFGSYIYNYVTYRAVEKKTKVIALVFLWISLILSILIVDNLLVRLVLLVVGLAVTTHIASLKTIDKV